MHSGYDNSGTWTFYYDGDGQPIAPDVIVGGTSASPQFAPVIDSGTYIFRPSDAGGEPAEARPAPTAIDSEPFVFTSGDYDRDLANLIAPRRCRCCEHMPPGRWLSEDPAGLFDGDASQYRYPADAPPLPREDAAS